jgi:hypothetical protein
MLKWVLHRLCDNRRFDLFLQEIFSDKLTFTFKTRYAPIEEESKDSQLETSIVILYPYFLLTWITQFKKVKLSTIESGNARFTDEHIKPFKIDVSKKLTRSVLCNQIYQYLNEALQMVYQKCTIPSADALNCFAALDFYFLQEKVVFKRKFSIDIDLQPD